MEDSVIEIIDLESEADETLVVNAGTTRKEDSLVASGRTIRKEDGDADASVVVLIDDDSRTGLETGGCDLNEKWENDDENKDDDWDDLIVIDSTPEFKFLSGLGRQGKTNRARVMRAMRRADEERAVDGGGNVRMCGRTLTDIGADADLTRTNTGGNDDPKQMNTGDPQLVNLIGIDEVKEIDLSRDDDHRTRGDLVGDDNPTRGDCGGNDDITKIDLSGDDNHVQNNISGDDSTRLGDSHTKTQTNSDENRVDATAMECEGDITDSSGDEGKGGKSDEAKAEGNDKAVKKKRWSRRRKSRGKGAEGKKTDEAAGNGERTETTGDVNATEMEREDDKDTNSSGDDANRGGSDEAKVEGNDRRKKRKRGGRKSRGKGAEGKAVGDDERMETGGDDGADTEVDEDGPPAKKPSLSPPSQPNVQRRKNTVKKANNNTKKIKRMMKRMEKKEARKVIQKLKREERKSRLLTPRNKRSTLTQEKRKRLSLAKDENGNRGPTTKPTTADDDDVVIELSDDEVVFVKEMEGKRRREKAPAFIPLISAQTSSAPALPMKKSDEDDDPKSLRPIVIDGCNVAFGHGKTKFSSLGLEKCIDYFERRGHKVTAFVPQFRRRHVLTQDPEVLDRLEKRGVVAFTPSRMVNRRMIASYDDRFIVEYATDVGGIIVTRDNYRDLLEENPEWVDTINNRLLMYTWVNDRLMFPHDPLGRNGPRLNEFLRFPKPASGEKEDKTKGADN